MRIVIVLALLASVARGLAIHATDAESGARLDGLRCVVTRGERVMARFDGPQHEGRFAAADVLRIYCRGYDLAAAPAGGDGPVRVALRRARETCTVVCDDADAGVIAEVSVRLQGPWKTPPIKDTFRVPLAQARTLVAVPRGLACRLYFEARDGIASPLGGPVRADQVVRVHVDRPRTMHVSYGEGSGRFQVFTDYLWTPDASPQQVDAWRWHLDGAVVVAEQLAGARPRVSVLPDTPLHVFARIGGRPLYRYVAAGQTKLDLAPVPQRRLPVAPIVDGRPVGPGTVVAPGRLDLYTVATLGDTHALVGCAVRVAPGPWSPVALPAAEWLTTWHPTTGLAHLAWNDLDPPRGGTCPAWLRIRVPEGRTATGTVSLFPVWRGAGTVRSTLPDRPLRRRLDGETREVVCRGLRPGRYGMQLGYTLRDRAGSEIRVRRMHEVAIPERGRSWTLPVR